MKDVKEIIITGGPCSGKTEGIAFVKKKLEKMGWRVFVAREKATDVILGGVRDLQELAKKDPKKYLELQKAILEWQICDINQIRKLAALFPDEPRVILCDRGPQDNAAYIRWDVFHGFLRDLGLSAKETCFDFDAVIHMVTAADGAEEHYNLANPARSEKDLKDVKDLDHRTLSVWLGHPHLFIIANSTDFPGKLMRLEKAVLRALGIPEPVEIERKFLVDTFHQTIIPAPFKNSLIEQCYIDIPVSEKFRGISGKARVRRELPDGSGALCRLTQKTAVSEASRNEVEIRIVPDEFYYLLKFRMSDTEMILKKRRYFVYKHQYFTLDVFGFVGSRRKRLCLLEIELLDENDKVELPPFLDIVREVTGDPEYTNSAIAKKR